MYKAEDIAKFQSHQQAVKSVSNDPYENTPFWAYRIMSSRKKGAAFEKLTKEFFKNQFGLDSHKSLSSDHDTIVQGRKLEIKGSMMWVNGRGVCTHFRWQQIRLSQDYDAMIFMAMYPQGIRWLWASKQDLIDNLDPKKYNQHGGKSVDSGTMAIDGIPETFPWMKEITNADFVKS